jgi:hypothetical protein
MPKYEYRVIAAPNRGIKAKGIKSNEARFAHALEETMNGMAAEGWEYQRAETLPSVERSGLTSTTTTWRNVLVFRRVMEAARERSQPENPPLRGDEPILTGATNPGAQEPTESSKKKAPPPVAAPQTPDDDASQSEGASRMLRDNGVEEMSEVSGMSSSLKQLAASRKPLSSGG